MNKLLTSLFIAIVAANSAFAQSTCEPNIDFETGTYSNWFYYIGSCCPAGNIYTPTPMTTPSSPWFNLTSGSGVDPCGGFPVVGAGAYSLQLGNTTTLYHAQEAAYYVHVPATASSYSVIYRVAFVLEDPAGHAAGTQPRMTVQGYDSASNTLISSVNYTSGTAPGAIGPVSCYSVNDVYYRPWTTSAINLTGHSGTTVRLEFATGDCGQGGHFGYGYVDMSCGLFAISSTATCGASTIQLVAPQGFASYEWFDSTTYSVLYGVTDTINMPAPSVPTTLAVILSPVVGFGSPDTLYTTVYPSSCSGTPVAGTVSSTALSACGSSPFTLSDAGCTGGIYYQWQSSPDSVTWSDISGATNTAYTVAGISSDTYYRFTDSCCTSGLASVTPGIKITYNTVSSAGSISGVSTVAAGGGSATLSDPVLGGTWTSGSTAIATINSSTGVYTGGTAGTAVITYTVAGCTGLISTTYTVTVSPINGISGNVIFDSSYSGNVKVWLITYNAALHDLEAIDSMLLACSGSSVYYQFTGAPTDSYRVKAAPIYPSGTTTGYIPTYHDSSYYWYSANVINHTSGSADINKNIYMMHGTATSGPGFISGNVTTGANRGTNTGIPVEGLYIYVFNTATRLIQSTVTDASGNYSFSNLPIGSYTVFPDSLNYITTPYTSVNLTTGSPSASSVDFIQHTISGTITPATTGVGNAELAGIDIYPNPATDELTVTLDANTYNSCTITDNSGKVLMRQQIKSSVTTVNIKSLPAGIYYITVKGNSGSHVHKFVKM